MSEADYRSVIEFLWDIIDDIDTADDAAKSNEVSYRRIVHRLQKKRWKTGIMTDGYSLDFTGMIVPPPNAAYRLVPAARES